MLLFSSALVRHKLTFTKLSARMDYVPVAAKWTEGEWGYIRNKGIEYREAVMRALRDNVYIGTYAGLPVAMFALLDHEFPGELAGAAGRLPHAIELMYVYVEKDYRGFGFGKQVIEEAKHIAAESGANFILLDTLKPGLNRLYEKHGAALVCESALFSHATDVLKMSI